MKKNSMVLMEFLLTVAACGILMALCVYSFRAKDANVAPYTYAAIVDIDKANEVVMAECAKKGTCNENSLPNSRLEYCLRLADNFVTSGDIKCAIPTTRTVDSKGYYFNFKLSNGISFYDIYTDTNLWEQPENNGIFDEYIDAFIDINSEKGDNKLGVDIFPIRIFKNGYVVPGHYANIKSYDDEDFFGYRVVLNKALSADNTVARVRETLDTKAGYDESNEYLNRIPHKERVSFKAGVCMINLPNISTNVLKYYVGDDENVNCNDYKFLSSCKIDSDPSAYCMIEPVKPRVSGIFRFFGL